MRIIPRTNLKIDPKKDPFPAGVEVDVKQELGKDLVKRGLATEPVIEVPAVDSGTGDEASGD